MKDYKALELLHYYNINSGIDSIYGNWVVSKDGDVVNYVYPYTIMSIHLYDEEWLVKVEKKTWFKQSCRSEFENALKRAYEILPNK